MLALPHLTSQMHLSFVSVKTVLITVLITGDGTWLAISNLFIGLCRVSWLRLTPQYSQEQVLTFNADKIKNKGEGLMLSSSHSAHFDFRSQKCLNS